MQYHGNYVQLQKMNLDKQLTKTHIEDVNR